MKRFKRGMTVLERRLLREEVLIREIAKAHRNARNYKLSVPCLKAMELVMAGSRPDMQRKLHGLCVSEDQGGPGCLCPCHDEDRGGVQSGTMPADSLDAPLEQ